MWEAWLSLSEGNSLLWDDQLTTVAPVASGVLVSCVMLVMCEEMKEVAAQYDISWGGIMGSLRTRGSTSEFQKGTLNDLEY